MNIKNSISLLQTHKGMTQSKIAAFIGCSQSNISRLTRGKNGLVRPSNKVVDGLRKLLAEKGLNEVIEEAR